MRKNSPKRMRSAWVLRTSFDIEIPEFEIPIQTFHFTLCLSRFNVEDFTAHEMTVRPPMKARDESYTQVFLARLPRWLQRHENWVECTEEVLQIRRSCHTYHECRIPNLHSLNNKQRAVGSEVRSPGTVCHSIQPVSYTAIVTFKWGR